MKIVHCDYGFCNFGLIPKYLEGISNASGIQFLIPASDTIGIPAVLSQSQVQVLGYPLRKEIKRSSEVAELRKKWEIKEGHKILFVMSGSQGACKDKIMKILNQIYISKSLPPTTMMIACGNNSTLRTEIDEAFPKKEELNYRSLGWIDAITVSELYSMSNLYIGKTGGATTAEIIAMGLLALGFAEYPPENNNLTYLIQREQALKLDVENVVEQIVELLKKSPKPDDTVPVDWRERLNLLVPSTTTNLHTQFKLEENRFDEQKEHKTEGYDRRHLDS